MWLRFRDLDLFSAMRAGGVPRIVSLAVMHLALGIHDAGNTGSQLLGGRLAEVPAAVRGDG
eukprot:11157338-Lingulodinium_polyedra.AAC.1